MTAPTRACTNPKFKRVIVVCGSQMAKTESMFNVIGHRLMDDPAPILYIGPTQKLVESYSDGRVMPMLRSTPVLWDRLAKGKKNKITEKFISGVRLGFGWAGSATELAGHPAAIVLVDERDRMDAVKGEGDPVALAEARVATYPDGRVIVASTPTLGNVMPVKNPETGLEHWAVAAPEDVQSPIWKLWQEGTRYEWAWPCPDCGEFFIPRFKLLKWPEDSTPQQALRATRLMCPHCGTEIEDRSKGDMNARGVYVAPGQRVERDGTVVGDIAENSVASFWVSGICSPWRSFGARAFAFLSAVRAGDQDAVQVAMNTGMGELYRVGGDAPDWQVVADLRDGREAGAVPDGVRVVTCGVDVQKNRLVYAVRGWGVNFESWLIEHGELMGETAYDEVWSQLSGVLEARYGEFRIRMMLVDSGYKPGEADRNPDNQVYLFCRRHKGIAFPSKGHDKQDKPYRASKIDVSYRGKVIEKGLDLWHLDTDYMKTWLHARLEWPVEAKSGHFHLHADATDDYCQQLVAESRAVAPSGRVSWIRVRKENHFLDCEGLNIAAAHILGVHTLKAAVKPQETSPEEQEKAPVKARPPARSNWVTGFRQR
jgi:phage terminase large subunit GpA-like protein